ncbi:MAG: hypothetical protein AAGA41_11620 [Pseudomonadota bacterium]
MTRRILTALALVCALAAPPLAADEDGPGPVVVRDPHYGEVLFHFYKGDYFSAIVRLSAAQEREQLTHHDDEAELLRGGLALSYGQHDEAHKIFRNLLDGNTAPEVRDRTWFFLAKIRYQRGFVDAAADALASIGDELPKDLEPERRMLQSQVYIEQERFDEAIELLDGWRGPAGWVDYARFNLGVALVRKGEFAEGANWLDRVGRLTDDRPEMLGLRDKANVALGYTWLQNEQPARARPILQRVRLNGPFSNKALLGVGWADSDRGNYRAALTPWTELSDRNLLDAAVQESLLAVPYALGKLDATRQAAARYEDAIVAFANEQQRIEDAIAGIESGEMINRLLENTAESEAIGWYWRLDAMPDATESRYLYLLMAGHRFQEALKNYRDVLELRNNLLEWKDKVTVFQAMIDTRKAGYTERLPRIEAGLEAADLDAIRARQAKLEARLNRIESERDLFALASNRERQLVEELDLAAEHPTFARSAPEVDDARRRLALMRGVLQWRAEKDFDARVWRQRKLLRETTRAIALAERARLAVDDTRINEPSRLVDFDHRVIQLSPRIDAKIADLELSLAAQRAYLHGLATEALREQQRRLDTYTVQARFALAAVYDRATAARNDAESPETTQ